MADTIVSRLRTLTARSPDHEVWFEKRDGAWRPYTLEEVLRWVEEVAAGLVSLGIGPGDRVGLVGENLPSWVATDYGIQQAAALSVPVYPTNSAEQVSYVLGHSGARLYFVDDDEQLAKAEEADLKVEHIVAQHLGEHEDGRLVGIDSLRSRGRSWLEDHPGGLDERVAGLTADTPVSIIYTSGTTGPPKGVVLTHGNFVWTGRAVVDRLNLRGEHRMLSYLPLSHSFERVVTTVIPMTGDEARFQIYFVPELPEVPAALREARPTTFVGVPRVYEKFYARILAEVGDAPAFRQRIFHSAVDAGAEAVRIRDEGGRISLGTKLLAGMAKKVVGKKVLREVGLDRCWYAASGAAPLSAEIQRFFQALGLPLHQGYGLTETTAPLAAQPVEELTVGTVGPPLDGVEVRLEEDGEVVVRGPNVFQGYYREPEKTAEVLDAQGWFRTGDIGDFAAGGSLRIVDRKKDLIITAGGKNIAPQEIEKRLKADRLINEAIVIGDGRPYLVALLALDPDETKGFLHHEGIEPGSPEEMAAHPVVQQHVEAVVEEVNGKLARVENVRKWRIIPEGFPPEAVTPTMKLKRRVVNERFAGVIEGLYS